MKKIVLAAVIATVSFAASAGEWRFLPLTKDKNFKLEPSLAVAVNAVDPKDGDRGTGYGIDFNFNCGVLQDPDNRMRTHLNIARTKYDDANVASLELSPRYMLPLSNNLSVGAGPSLAIYKVKIDKAGYDHSLPALGVAMGANYRMGAFYFGADARYHDTKKKDGVEYDNWTIGGKVGFNF